tara:strand:- start:270 stop:521 length:252 start_codon:yes stop_codon:yes gene_type:complete
MMMKRNLEVEEIQGTINALVDTRRVTATSLKNQMTKRAMVVTKRKAIATEISERARKKLLTKTSEITKPNSTEVEINLQFTLV